MSFKQEVKLNKSEKDKNAAFQERLHAILDDLLKDEDNKYCADCDAKGPRWASWNLGVFLCIRCAGIHRKMGVHIARVKSVNLDSWTPEQVAMMQEIGNSRGRAIYEANLSENFRRPQTDSGIEAFIFAKYTQRKYIAREWVPPKPNVEAILNEVKKKTRNHSNSEAIQHPVVQPSQPSQPSQTTNSAKDVSAITQKPQATPNPPAAVNLISVDDLLSDGTDFGAFESYSVSNNGVGSAALSSDMSSLIFPSQQNSSESVVLQNTSVNSANSDLVSSLETVNTSTVNNSNQSKKTKEDILKLYGGTSPAATSVQNHYAASTSGMYPAHLPAGPMMPMYGTNTMLPGNVPVGMMPPTGYATSGAVPYAAYMNSQQMMPTNVQLPPNIAPPSYASSMAANVSYQPANVSYQPANVSYQPVQYPYHVQPINMVNQQMAGLNLGNQMHDSKGSSIGNGNLW